MPAKKKTTATPTGLQADAHADRSAALAELRAKEARARDGRVASLQEQIREAHARHDANIADAERTIAARYEELCSAFVEAWRAEIDPLVSEWMEQPTRALAKSIGVAIERFDARALRELRGPVGASPCCMSPALVASALADVLISERPAAVNAFGRADWGLGASIHSLLANVRKATRVAGPELHRAVEGLERALRSAAGAVQPASFVNDAERRRYALKRSTATEADLRVRMMELDREIEAERAARVARAHQAREARIR